MYAQVEKTKENKNKAVANFVDQKKNNGRQGFGFVDNRPEAITQRKLQGMMNDYSSNNQRPLQKRGNARNVNLTPIQRIKAAKPEAKKAGVKKAGKKPGAKLGVTKQKSMTVRNKTDSYTSGILNNTNQTFGFVDNRVESGVKQNFQGALATQFQTMKKCFRKRDLGNVVQRADVRDATAVDAGAPIPAIGYAASANLNGMAGAWGGATHDENRAKLIYIINLPSITAIVNDLKKTAADTGSGADDMNITYSDTLADHGVALTNYHNPANWTEINIEIGPSAFGSGSLLYSTIRHELIHAAQHRRTDAKEQNWGGNIDLISNTTNVEFNLGSYQPYANPANQTQVLLQPIIVQKKL